MRKVALTILSIVMGMTSAVCQQQVTVTGTVKFFEPGDKVTLTQRGDYVTNTLAEAPVNSDGTYRLNVPVQKAGLGMLSCGYDRISVWLEDEDFNVNFQGRDTSKVIRMIVPRYIGIEGGKKNDVMNTYNFLSGQSYQTMIDIYNNVKGDDVSKERLDTIRGELMKAAKARNLELTRKFVRDNRNTTSVLALVGLLSEAEDSALIEETLDAVIAANPTSTVAQDYRKARAERIALENAVKVGAPAPDLTFSNLRGKPVSISSFKGKVLIVDFWASWCGPCRAEIPVLKETYEAYKENNRVAFLSISIDQDKDAWLKAVKDENMPWEQLLAPNSGQEALKTYQFSGIPFIICIAEDGTIFRKQIRGKAIRAAIEDALNKN